MKHRNALALVLAALLGACSGGGRAGGGSGGFRLLEFVDAGKDNLARNHPLVFQFSQPVASNQDLAQRLKIQNVDTGANGSNFAQAVGLYVVEGETIRFLPQLPETADKSDAGFRAGGNYHVYLPSGPDALVSTSGSAVAQPQDLLFDTGAHFEDLQPASPPRATALAAVDVTSGTSVDLARLDASPSSLGGLDNRTLLDAGRIIDPGAGGPPNYATAWHFDLQVSEPLDPGTVVAANVELLEIREDALDADNQAAPGRLGNAVNFKVPVDVSVLQGYDAAGSASVVVRVVPLQTLVDDARYRLTFSGEIRGIDDRELFIGENGLTGDGLSGVEPGGLGYTTEFCVYDRPAISSERVLTYDPLVDGIQPETGGTTLPGDLSLRNTALYDPATQPGMAVGFLPAFGDGSDGALSVPGGTTKTIDTGDVRNPDLGNPFTVQDLNPDDDYLGNPLPGGPLVYDSPKPFEMHLSSLVVSSSGTLKIVGKNPILFRVSGITQISGRLESPGGAGQNAGGSMANGGAGGAGGYDGATTKSGLNACNVGSTTCQNFTAYLNSCPGAKSGFPFSVSGNGPGRGYAGGEMFGDYSTDQKNACTGTGGGGGSHATPGTAGEDRLNLGAAPGTVGPSCSTGFENFRNSGVIGVRGQPGPLYGDRDINRVIVGGSGGGSGGSTHQDSFASTNMAGGGGGGGGGSISIVSAGSLVCNGAILNVSGGDGGKGAIRSAFTGWDLASGGGGAGSGGSLVLVSGGDIQLTGAILDATGGHGGARANVGSTITCGGCNAGGDGGKGYLLLMDADGTVTGLLPGDPGEYDDFSGGVLTVRKFDASRFSSIRAITELFSVRAADPRYQNFAASDIVASVHPGQTIVFRASSAQPDPEDPLRPDPAKEISAVEVARALYSGGATTIVLTGDLSSVNTQARDAFLRIQGEFEYDNGVEAAVGPFATISSVAVHFTFNG